MKVLLQHMNGGELPVLLAAAGFPLDLRCGGHGSCNRCRVTLLSGRYLLERGEHEIFSPVEVKACRTRMLSDEGEVEIPASALLVRNALSAVSWDTAPLPVHDRTVIGVDLGTTTVAAVKVRNGEVIAAAGGANLQAHFGDNVMTRIEYASRGAGQLEELRKAAVESINLLLGRIDAWDTVRIALAGNTVMSSLFHGIDPASIGVYPFKVPQRVFSQMSAGDCALCAPAGIPVLTAPCISGYVGGDLVAGLAEIELGRGEMLLDIGTNCEMIYHTRRGLFCSAAAAGPAFEGAGIACGCRAAEGAIDHIFPDGSFSTLGGAAPAGLCGSAMIDLLAVLRNREMLNEFGRLVPKADFYEITPGLRLTEGDIEQLLKAKAAVASGIEALVKHCKEPLRKIHLAGGFARYLDIDNAVRIGLLPGNCEYAVIGNSSLAGAARLAVSPERLAMLERLIDLPQAVHLNELDGFEDCYIDGLLLP